MSLYVKNSFGTSKTASNETELLGQSSQKTGSAISCRSAEAGVFTGGFRELGNLVSQLRTQKTKQSVTDLTQNTSVIYS